MEELPAEIRVQIFDYLIYNHNTYPADSNEYIERAERYYRIQQLRSSSRFFLHHCTSYLVSKFPKQLSFTMDNSNWNPATSAAYNGFQTLLDLNKQFWSFECCRAAIAANRLDILYYLRDNNCLDYDDVNCIAEAVTAGQLEIIKSFEADQVIKCMKDHDVMCNAASNEHTNIMKYFIEEFGVQIESWHVTSAIHYSNNPECISYALKYMKQKNFEEFLKKTSYTSAAAGAGNLDLLKHLRSLGVAWDFETPDSAAFKGSAECLQYALENGCWATSEAIGYALRNGHVECVKIADRYGCDWHVRAQQVAIVNDRVECLKLAYIHDGKKWDFYISSFAAKFGALNCLKYMHENGCEWHGSELRNAVAGRHMSCVKYLHEEKGMNWCEDACEVASRGGTLLDCTFDFSERYFDIKKSAECLQYVHERGAVWTEDTCKLAAENDQIECLIYAHEHGCPWDSRMRQIAIEKGYEEILRYADQQGCPTVGTIDQNPADQL